jgi:predicted TPR repeat methyltransferase
MDHRSTARPAPATNDASARIKKDGDDAVARDDFARAAECYRQAVALDAANIGARVGLAFAALETGRYDEAEKQLTVVTAERPDIADGHYLLARLHRERNGQPGSDEVVRHLRKTLELDPHLEPAYHELTAELMARGNREGARATLQSAVQAFPDSAEFRYRLGSLAFDGLDYPVAILHFEAAVRLQPKSAELHCMLADALRDGGQPERAIAHYRNAVVLQPDLVSGYIALGQVLEKQGRLDEAIAAFRQAVDRDATLAAARHHLANVYLLKGEKTLALESLREVVRLQPDAGVEHLVQALSGGRSDVAPARYVEALFDSYADRFDSHLVKNLRYTIPEELAQRIIPRYEPGAKLDILDLGCGTGLAGAAVASLARRLVGVDLSGKMLEKAAERNLYQRLEQLDLVEMMDREAPEAYDLVLAADVLVYIGRLEEVVSRASRLLRPRGLFAFSVEALEPIASATVTDEQRAGFQLLETGRYAHTADYLDETARSHRFAPLLHDRVHGRIDRGHPVQHHLCVWRRE